MGFGVGTPGAHLVRIVARVLLHGAGGAAVGIALAQDRVDDAAEHLGIARLDVFLGCRRGIVRIVRNVVALALQFLDCGPELRDRGGDVGQLYDVGLGPQRKLAEFGELVVDALRRGELVRNSSEDAAGQRDVLQRHRHARRAHEGFDDRQQRIGRERRGFIDLCPHDFEIWHACTLSRRACLGRPETEHFRARGGMISPAGPRMDCSRRGHRQPGIRLTGVRRAPYSIGTAAEKADISVIPGPSEARSPESISPVAKSSLRSSRRVAFRGYGFRAPRYARPRNDTSEHPCPGQEPTRPSVGAKAPARW